MRTDRRRTLLSLGFGLALALLGADALACRPVEVGDAVRPVVHDGTTAAALLRRASALESAAQDLDATARESEGQGATLARRARVLRIAASSASPFERRRLLDQAFDLDARADEARARAADERAEASELRGEARRLRERARALQGGGGGGWGLRPNRQFISAR